MGRQSSDTLRLGEAAPDFTLTSAEGETVNLTEFRGASPLILFFFRGTW